MLGGKWASAAACPLAGRIGKCTATVNGVETTDSWYSGCEKTATDLEQSCTSGQMLAVPGTWTAG